MYKSENQKKEKSEAHNDVKPLPLFASGTSAAASLYSSTFDDCLLL